MNLLQRLNTNRPKYSEATSAATNLILENTRFHYCWLVFLNQFLAEVRCGVEPIFTLFAWLLFVFESASALERCKWLFMLVLRVRLMHLHIEEWYSGLVSAWIREDRLNKLFFPDRAEFWLNHWHRVYIVWVSVFVHDLVQILQIWALKILSLVIFAQIRLVLRLIFENHFRQFSNLLL
jgi:hypothetical protein